MNNEDALNSSLVVYWWNLGRKTLDFKGTYRDYLKRIGAKYSMIKNGYRFRISTSTSSFQLDSISSKFIETANDAIVLFLTLMGDKASINSTNIVKKINWW